MIDTCQVNLKRKNRDRLKKKRQIDNTGAGLNDRCILGEYRILQNRILRSKCPKQRHS